jgi:hypothetical protein
LTVFMCTQAAKRPSLLMLLPFSFNLLPWRPPTKLSACGMYK